LSDRHPLYHKAVTGTYSPGSTFKMMVGIAARRAGMPEDWAVSCPGYFPFGGRNFHCWRRGGHGRVDMHAAIKGSCDVFFYRAALYAGAERIAQVSREFGFGQTYEHLNLPSMRTGIVPDPAWWRSIGRGQWTDGLTVNFGIGQGDLQVTPIQLAVMTARMALIRRTWRKCALACTASPTKAAARRSRRAISASCATPKPDRSWS
jgi:penicillin-binding protein 2